MYEHNGKTFADSCKSHQQDPFLGTGGPTKMDEFSEKFQTAFDPPPPSFSENHIADFATKVHMFILAGLLYII